MNFRVALIIGLLCLNNAFAATPNALYESTPSPSKTLNPQNGINEKLEPNEVYLYGDAAATVGGFEDSQGQPVWQGWTCHDLSDWHGVVREVVIRESYQATTLYDRMEAFYTGHPLVSAVYRVQALTPGMTTETALILVGWPEVALTPTEITVLQDALAGGGAVVFVGEQSDPIYNTFNANISAALGALGSNLYLGMSSFNSNYHVASRANGQLLDHPDIGHIDNVSYALSGHILGSLPSEQLFLTTSLVNVWGCVQDIGGGKVWTFADGSVWDQAYYENRGNGELATRFLKPRKLVGSFCKIFENLGDADPAINNFTPQMTFIDDGTSPLNYPGETTGGTDGVNCTWGPGGYSVNTSGGMANFTNGLYNEIWSPTISLDAQGANTELLTRTLLRFEVYMDAPLNSGLAYTWRVRSKPDYSNNFNYGGWSAWQNQGAAYTTSSPRYLQREIDIADLIVAGAQEIQIALGVIDQADGVGQPACTGPYFDNVSVVQAAQPNNYDDCVIPMPLQDYTSPADSRGYWFEAPRDMVISGVRVPTDASSGEQSVQIVRIDEGDVANFDFPIYSGNFTSLFHVPITPDSGILNVNVAVNKGDKIGVVGGRTDDQVTLQSSFAASPLNNPYKVNFANQQVEIFGLISREITLQGSISSLTSSRLAEVGRIEIYIDQCDDIASCSCPLNDQAWASAAADTGIFGIGPRRGYAMAYDPDRETTVLFGGDYGGGRRNDTWELNNDVWLQIDDGYGAVVPSHRVAAEMAYDTDRQVMVLYGGSTNSGPSGETWEWQNGAWTQIITATDVVRSSLGMAYDQTRGLMVRYGGNGVGGRGRSTFEYDGTSWTTAVSVSPPGYRSYHEMTYSTELGGVLLFGGHAPGAAPLGDTWLYDGSWALLTSTGPSPRREFGLANNPDCDEVFLFGGDTGVDNNELWKFTGGAWTQVNILGAQPTARERMELVYHKADRRLVTFGGWDKTNTMSDRWSWGCSAGNNGGFVSGVTPGNPISRVLQCYPNPFNPTTTIQYAVAKSGPTNLSVYDISGRLVRNLVDGRIEAGEHEAMWRGRDEQGNRVASGLYFYALKTDETQDVGKMVLLK